MYFNHRISSTYRSLIAILREKLIVLHFISISYVYMFYMYFLTYGMTFLSLKITMYNVPCFLNVVQFYRYITKGIHLKSCLT